MNNNDDELKQGSFVYASAGRDKGRYFVVVAVFDNYVMICDGKTRRVESPKLKKLKHIKPGYGCSELIYGHMSEGRRVTNKEVRQELEKFLNKE